MFGSLKPSRLICCALLGGFASAGLAQEFAIPAGDLNTHGIPIVGNTTWTGPLDQSGLAYRKPGSASESPARFYSGALTGPATPISAPRVIVHPPVNAPSSATRECAMELERISPTDSGYRIKLSIPDGVEEVEVFRHQNAGNPGVRILLGPSGQLPQPTTNQPTHPSHTNRQLQPTLSAPTSNNSDWGAHTGLHVINPALAGQDARHQINPFFNDRSNSDSATLSQSPPQLLSQPVSILQETAHVGATTAPENELTEKDAASLASHDKPWSAAPKFFGPIRGAVPSSVSKNQHHSNSELDSQILVPHVAFDPIGDSAELYVPLEALVSHETESELPVSMLLVGPRSLEIGTTAEFEIQIANKSLVDFADLVIEAEIPAGFVLPSLPSSSTFDEQRRVLSWKIDDSPSGHRQTLRYLVTAQDAGLLPQKICLLAAGVLEGETKGDTIVTKRF